MPCFHHDASLPLIDPCQRQTACFTFQRGRIWIPALVDPARLFPKNTCQALFLARTTGAKALALPFLWVTIGNLHSVTTPETTRNERRDNIHYCAARDTSYPMCLITKVYQSKSRLHLNASPWKKKLKLSPVLALLVAVLFRILDLVFVDKCPLLIHSPIHVVGLDEPTADQSDSTKSQHDNPDVL
jgi:hypothetical protein